jgi:hypothetical protein
MKCEKCKSTNLAFLGKLGVLYWFRCRGCGWEMSNKQRIWNHENER